MQSVRMIQLGGVVSACMCMTLALTPLAHAQTEHDALRNSIRTALMEDSRTQNLTPEELDEMITALAERAVEQGVAEAYIAETTLPMNTESAPVQTPSFSEGALYLAILASLAIALALFYLLRSRMRKHGEVD